MDLPIKRPASSSPKELNTPPHSPSNSTPKKVSSTLSFQEEYACQGVSRYRFKEIATYKQTGKYPDYILSTKVSNRKYKRLSDFLMTADNYEFTQQLISPLSQSRLCYKFNKCGGLYVIPYKSEVEAVIKALHIENGTHYNVTNTRERTKLFKVYWPGHHTEISEYINKCFCKSRAKPTVFKRSE